MMPPGSNMLVCAGNNHAMSPVTKARLYCRHQSAKGGEAPERDPKSSKGKRLVLAAKTWGLTYESPAGLSPAHPGLSELTAARSCSGTESAGSTQEGDVVSRGQAGEVQGKADSYCPETTSGITRLIAAV